MSTSDASSSDSSGGGSAAAVSGAKSRIHLRTCRGNWSGDYKFGPANYVVPSGLGRAGGAAAVGSWEVGSGKRPAPHLDGRDARKIAAGRFDSGVLGFLERRLDDGAGRRLAAALEELEVRDERVGGVARADEARPGVRRGRGLGAPPRLDRSQLLFLFALHLGLTVPCFVVYIAVNQI